MPHGGPPPPRPPGTPADVVISWQPADPTPRELANLGVRLKKRRPMKGAPKHRLVIIGDSLSHGFKNYAISDTEHSWPAIVAYELGWLGSFSRPSYRGPKGMEGLPLNLEALARQMEKAAKGKWHPIGWLLMVASLWWSMARVRWYWQWGPGRADPPKQVHHNLAIYGWDVRDSFDKSLGWCEDKIKGRRRPKKVARRRPKAKGSGPLWRVLLWLLRCVLWLLCPLANHPNERAARLVLWGEDGNPQNTQLSLAKALGEQGTDKDPNGAGIETLVIELGANNALGTIVSMKLAWSQYPDYQDVDSKDQFTIWDPTHFKLELDQLVARVKEIRARHVIWASVPHVTIAPLAHGIGEKPYYSRYFARYTYVITPDSQFDGNVDPSLSADEARTIDSVIDSYNTMIKGAVLAAREDNLDWYYFDGCGLLDSMAYRRYFEDARTRPPGWMPYPFPEEFNGLSPFPDTRFITSDEKGGITGGLIGLDGVHPTALGYGIVAQEMIKVMQLAGVVFKREDGTVRRGPVRVCWKRLIENEPLVNEPLTAMGEDLGRVGFLVEVLDLAKYLLS